MTKKHFDALSAVLREAKPDAHSGRLDPPLADIIFAETR